MKNIIKKSCDYHKYCWNKALAMWNDMYNNYLKDNTNKKPSRYIISNKLNNDKQQWEYNFSSRIFKCTLQDLETAWKMYFNNYKKGWGKPKFKLKKDPCQEFKTDRAKIINGKLHLDVPLFAKDKNKRSDITIYNSNYELDNIEIKLASIYYERDNYYAVLSINKNINKQYKATNRKTAVDLNIGHFNYTDGEINILPEKVKHLYKRIIYYQKILARKRKVNGKLAYLSNNYVKVKTKLQRDYKKIVNIQNDILHKFTTQLIKQYDVIVIEDLDIKDMLMSHVASKMVHCSQFGKFREYITYKCKWYNRKLIIADKYYPSTQRCSQCGYIKRNDEKITLQGNKKHHTKHNEYICYQCGAIMDRDENAVNNLLALV